MRSVRYIALAVAAALLFSLLPVGASAAPAEYDVWVNGVRLTEDNARSGVKCGMGTAVYSAEDATLTITDTAMTKIHEEIWRTDLEEACKYYDENPPKGEFVLVIEGNKKTEKETVTLEYAAELARMYMEEGDSASEAARKAAKETGFTKSDIYKAAREKEE